MQVLVTRDRGEELLGSLFHVFRRIVYRAEAEANELLGPGLHRLEPRTRASVLNDYISGAVQREFQDDPEFRPARLRGLKLFCFGSRSLVRVKKLGVDLRTSNIPTRQNTALMSQRPMFLPNELPPEAPRFVLGYQVDDFGAVAATYITHPNGNSVAWAIPLDDRDAGSGQLDFISPPQPAPKPATGRVVAKKEQQKQRGIRNGSSDESASG